MLNVPTRDHSGKHFTRSFIDKKAVELVRAWTNFVGPDDQLVEYYPDFISAAVSEINRRDMEAFRKFARSALRVGRRGSKAVCKLAR